MGHKILIADSSKPSLVMTSEVFKDKLPGCVVIVASTGEEVLAVLSNAAPDMAVVDFDLPDSDGATLISAMREVYSGPILMTAHPDPVVRQAVEERLFTYNDCGSWVPKPVRAEELAKRIDIFITDRHRLGKRFETSLTATLVGKSEGRGKRSPKVTARVVNCSVGGACLELDLPIRVKGIEEVTVSLNLPEAEAAADDNELQASLPNPKTAKTKGKAAKDSAASTKIRATIQWLGTGGKTCGLQFGKLSPQQRRGLDLLLRSCAETDIVAK